MKKFLRYTALLLIIFLITYNIWSAMGRAGNAPANTSVATIIYQAFGADSGKGNVIGLQPYLTTTDYKSEATAYILKKLNGSILRATLLL